eukprot:GHUV01026807.1.p1 GENE.GHUV01026807.1~~GHUV01026807.1.p1  ORF type:complete len:612 (+),score=124.44 GHUV01026807.1:250-2085(+)
MRWAAAVAVLVAVTGSAVASTDGIPGLEMLTNLHDTATSTLFPAGMPRFQNAYKQAQYEAPTVPENAYRGVYGWTTCQTDVLIRPDSTQQLASAIKDVKARAAKEGRPLKMRAARFEFATMNSLPCGRQPTMVTPFTVGGKTPLVVGIMMDQMNQVLHVDHAKLQLKLQAQMNLKGLIAAADANDMSIPVTAVPWWQRLTLGGIFSTASHGSGNNATSMICDWFVEVTWVDANGDIHTSVKGTEDAKALCGGIGLLGVIAEITLQMKPTTNSWFKTWYLKDDAHLAEDIEAMLKITPHLVVHWRPDLGKYTGHLQGLAPDNSKAIDNAECSVIPQMSQFTGAVTGPMLRSWQGDPFNKNAVYFTGFDTGICAGALTAAIGAPWMAKHVEGVESMYGSGLVPLYEGIAATNHAASTECGDRCAFTNKKMEATAADVEFAFEHERLPQVIADIKELIKKDLRGIPGWGAHTRCLLPGYYVFRFGVTPETYIGNAAGLKAPVYVQQQMLAARGTPGIPTRYEWVQASYEQLMLCKHEGRPHTGKNWDRTFTNPRYTAELAEAASWLVPHCRLQCYRPQQSHEPWKNVLDSVVDTASMSACILLTSTDLITEYAR